ncbi:unnamed protein product, partial [Prorocentrum cordatum]
DGGQQRDDEEGEEEDEDQGEGAEGISPPWPSAVEAFRDQRAAKEARLAELEASRDEAEADEANARQRRDGLKKELPVAKELVAAARAAEKDAVAERHDLHNKCSKVERAQHEMEEAKNSAIRALHAEEYNATQ